MGFAWSVVERGASWGVVGRRAGWISSWASLFPFTSQSVFASSVLGKSSGASNVDRSSFHWLRSWVVVFPNGQAGVRRGPFAILAVKVGDAWGAVFLPPVLRVARSLSAGLIRSRFSRIFAAPYHYPVVWLFTTDRLLASAWRRSFALLIPSRFSLIL